MIKEPQCKICRGVGKKLMLKGERCLSSKCAIVKRNYPAGLHGQKNTRKKLTEYGKQLREKQKAKRVYGVYEKVFKKYYQKAVNSRGDIGQNLVKILESRLDNVIYRVGIAKSRRQAKQLVGHGHFFVNERKTDIPSFRVKIGDIIKIKPSKMDKSFFKNLKEEFKNKKDLEIPGWLHFDKSKMEIKVLSDYDAEGKEQIFDTKMIIEFYSR